MLAIYYQLYNLDFIILRYANVYGPRQNIKGEAGVIAIFIDKLLSGQQPTINGNGKQTRDYVYIGDVTRTNLLALQNRKVKNGIYNVGTSQEITVNGLFKKITSILKTKIKPKHGPVVLGEIRRSALDCQKIQRDFGWRSEINFDQGLEKTIAWYKNKE